MLSAIVPTLNAATTLPACLQALREADEVVVIDGGSTDATCRIAEERSVRIFGAPHGMQLREGAEAAWGEWLLFVDAGTILAPGWRSAVERHIHDHSDKAAFFRFRLDKAGLWARLVECGVRGIGLPLGSQGLLISRNHYDEVGGFRPVRSLEETDLRRRIGRARLRRIDVEAVSRGRLRSTVGAILSFLSYKLGVRQP